MLEHLNLPLTGIRLFIGPIIAPRDVKVRLTDYLNPGIGGSEFYFMRLAHELSRQGAHVTLVCSGSKVSLENPNIEVVGKMPEFATLNSARAILISSTYAYRRFLHPAAPGIPLILVSHHPHDGDLASILKVRKDFLLVNLGEYQYLSNKLKSVPSVILPVLTPPPSFRPVEPVPSGIVGHLSSLVPSKGFHHLARAWGSISRSNPHSRLEVVGGSSLYGFPEDHPRLPTSLRYGNRIEELLDNGGNSKSVKFFGVISGSIENRVGNWTLTVLNPAGIAEADPSSVKDCMRQGVPVVGAFDYGLRSYLRKFPELQIKSPRNTARVVNHLLSRPLLITQLSERIKSFYLGLFDRNSSIVDNWTEILLGVSSSQSFDSVAEKVMTRYVWEEQMLFKIRIIVRKRVIYPLLQLMNYLRRI